MKQPQIGHYKKNGKTTDVLKWIVKVIEGLIKLQK